MKCLPVFKRGITHLQLAMKKREHNNKKRGAKYTRTRRPVKLLAYVDANSRSEALKLELEVKRQRKKDKIKFLLSKKGS